MSRVVIVGAGPVGLASAILLAREGHEVVVLEKDPQGPPTTALSCWEKWERAGVAQFRQIHVMHARVRHVLDAEFPDVRDDIVGMGGRRASVVGGFLRSLDDPSPRAGDEIFDTITARRPVVESAFARAAENTPGVKVARGVAVEAPLVEGEANGVPRVVGVRTKDGEDIRGDLVIDAMGRRSRFVDWVEGVGGRAPHEETSDAGFAYYTRHYRCREGFEPELRTLPFTLLSTFLAITLPADNETWAVALIAMAGDKPMKAIRDNTVWEHVVRSVPHMAHWIEGDPIHDVLPMAGAMDRYRRFVLDEQPVIAGMLAVGDSWACTNPTAGRGISMGLSHAVALRDTARAHFDDPYQLALAFDEVTEQKFTPWFLQQQDRDRDRIAAIQAAIEGREPPKHDADDPIADLKNRFMVAAMHDPDVGRGFAEVTSVLALPVEVMARPGMIEKVTAASEGRAMPPPPGPTRAQILDVVAAA